MDYFYTAIATFLSLLVLVIIFVPMEKMFPAKASQKFFRPHWTLDLCFFLGQYFIWSGLILWALSYFGGWLHNLVPQGFRASVAAQPLFLQAAEVIVLSDFLIYWAHRLQHNVSFLWRFHKIHHSTEHLDWLAAHREHPLGYNLHCGHY